MGGDGLGAAGRAWWLWKWLESRRQCPYKEFSKNKQKAEMSLHSRGLVAKGALVLWAASLGAIPVPVQAAKLNIVRDFNCGTLGKVTLRWSSNQIFSRKAGHTVSAATITIPRKGIRQNGILHSVMGGNDRTFTRQESDNFRSIDDTSSSNPVMMQVMVGNFFYGKKREQVTVTLMQEAYTCIPD